MSVNNKRIYLKFNFPASGPGSETLLTGIKKDCKTLYISGWFEPPGAPPGPGITSFLYKGDLRGTTGPCNDNSWNLLNFPGAYATNLYGPEPLKNGDVRVVGNYTLEPDTNPIGCMYEGPLDGSGKWITLTPDIDINVTNTIAHSTSGRLVVGNYDTFAILGKAFIYDVKTKQYHGVIKPGSISITAYGIWHNGGDHYTICGGYSNINTDGIDVAYVVDWNNKTHKFSNWAEYRYNNDDVNSTITHFDGISPDGCGGYNFTGDALYKLEPIAFTANIKRRGNGVPTSTNKCDCIHNRPFGRATWELINFPGSEITSGNSIACDTVIGVYIDPIDPADTINGYISIIL